MTLSILNGMTHEDVSLIADISLALSFIIALIFGIAQFRQAARDRRERFTMETLRNLQSREFAELSGLIGFHRIPENFDEFERLPLKEQAKLIQFAEEMESLGLLVAEKLIDIDLLDKTLGSFVMNAWRKYQTVFREIRERHQDPYLGEYFEWLAGHLNDRLSKYPRQPFHLAQSSTIANRV